MAAERVPVTTIHDRELEREAMLPVHGYDREPLSWSSIVSGFLIGLTAWALLNLLGVALGLTAFNAGQAAAQGAAPATEAGINSVIWAGIVSIIAYLVGGFAASRIASVRGRDRGAGNGAMVFLLSVPFMLVMAALGVSGMLGGLGGLAGGAAEVASQQAPNIQNAIQGQGGVTITPPDAARVAEAARNAAWGAFIGMLIALGAAALGGLIGARDIDRREVRVTEAH